MKVKYAGLDLGNRSVNVKTADGLDTFISVHANIEQRELIRNLEEEQINFKKSSMVIEYGKESFAIGDYCFTRSLGAVRNFSDDKYSRNSEKAKMLAAFSLLYPKEREIDIDTLVVSLPPEIYEDHKDAICRELAGNYDYYIYDNNSQQPRTIRIKHVGCVEQCGVVAKTRGWNYDPETENLRRDPVTLEKYHLQYVIYFDLGGKTSEVYIYEGVKDDKSGKIRLRRVKTYPMDFGTSQMYQTISDELFSGQYDANELEYLLTITDSIPFKGKKVSVNKNDYLARFAGSAVQELSQLARPYMLRLATLGLIGGGFLSSIVADEFKKAFSSYEVLVSADPQTDNVEAQFLMAVALQKKREVKAVKADAETAS